MIKVLKSKLKTRVYHIKGVHHSNVISYSQSKHIKGEVTFDENSTYNIDVDQGDWNKLTGIKNQYFFPLKNAVMIAWRNYNNTYELAPYCHNGVLRKLYPSKLDSDVITVGNYKGLTLGKGLVGNKFTYEIEAIEEDIFNITITNGDDTLYYQFHSNTKYTNFYCITPDFGGNRTATCSFDLLQTI